MNKTQKRIMLEYLSKHENMALGRLTDTFTKIDHDNMWRDLGKKLDAIRGWDRPYHDWKKVTIIIRIFTLLRSYLCYFTVILDMVGYEVQNEKKVSFNISIWFS